ncbi:MAG: bifunctional DNA-formamidopyrimidine glycosylase/DNA-(apurinic or apyrimidinic site) lyase [Gammaproteobacteria bacterium]|nr:bifunctional DNA-formamidopyrimidine glycosylase/DNA-(apurinic or apyrimidinic site) lyase [Gammaproteobacteria bacterium]MDH5593073.1 bifunctional DNA-formamidopyrimidine glycosylase/DNA-(apurinic or apyrimidinic site) lyase [Gammaproteobacteria bacterium]MDH5614327.1 bifunctional DNA-formamidopyrimidine glycosylase/DNA-(apurinic or apyrimidinic site) lyase [Gammaproteobacteria bacterium]
MPELPEVETTRLGIVNHLKGQKIIQASVYHAGLRWPVPSELPSLVKNKIIHDITRRGKYLLFHLKNGTILIHLGMSGSLRLTDKKTGRDPYEHVEFRIGKYFLRLRDPRRFGAVLWTSDNPELHPLLAKLGPEPLESEFNTDYLYKKSRKRQCAIKDLLMNSQIVAGLGNIYVNESLYVAGIRPTRTAGKLRCDESDKLVKAIKKILEKSLKAGGTTLRDFSGSSGEPGYFKQQLLIYGRDGEKCTKCKTKIKRIKQGQRSSFYCPTCQR